MEVKITQIKKNYRGKAVLKGIDLTTQTGRCIGILGANGSGKSTLLSILAGILPHNGGSFVWDDKDLFRNRKLHSALVGYVPQGTALMEELTAWDNLRLWYEKEELQEELESGVLKMLGIADFLKVPVRKMSGGMKKRLSIGCAVAKRPPILLLDEPTAALDVACKQDIARYLMQYKRSGGLLLLTTHDVPELELCDEWYILKNGVLEPFHYDGDLQKLVERL